MLKQFVEKLAEEWGYGDVLSSMEDGSFILPVEPSLQISLRENRDSGITLTTTLAPLPQGKAEEFLIAAMSANLFGKETGGSALGLNREGTHVTLTGFVPPDANYKDFYSLLEDFVNYAEAWREETSAFGTGKRI